jgi:Ca2+-binding EF-hand superfamily protein
MQTVNTHKLKRAFSRFDSDANGKLCRVEFDRFR